MENNLDIKIGENDIKQTDVVMVNQLLRQMNSNAIEITIKQINAVMSFGIIITLRDPLKNHALIGMGTLIPVRKLFSFTGTIEDVVVDEAYRGKGLGKAIMKALLEESKKLGIKFVDLTSKPEKVAANDLYQSIGFEKRNTNVYRFYNK